MAQARNVAVPAPCLLVGVVVIGWLCEGMRATTNTTLHKIWGFIAGFLLRPLLEAFLQALLLRLRMVRFRALGFGNGRSSVPKLVYRARSRPWQHELAESIPAVDCPFALQIRSPASKKQNKNKKRVWALDTFEEKWSCCRLNIRLDRTLDMKAVRSGAPCKQELFHFWGKRILKKHHVILYICGMCIWYMWYS